MAIDDQILKPEEQKELDSLKSELDAWAAGELTEQEKGEAALDFAMVYARTLRKINDDYISHLDKLIAYAKAVNKKEEDVEKGLGVFKVKKKIADL